MSQMKANQFTSVRPNGTLRVSTVNNEPSKTNQQFLEECDIHNVMKKYSRTGQISHLAQGQAFYADFASMPDYKAQMDMVIRARDSFQKLPPAVQKRFGHDPGSLIQFLNDPSNIEEAIRLGLMERKTQPVINDDSNNDKTTAVPPTPAPKKTASSKTTPPAPPEE